ncbi:hypothetical protein SAMN05216188_13019 [Lentzea xinjiangensis]|uniref:Uncharacterized protein n=1 Tax=Lentzea xinjiangensis TaxID=402600 RepID=A0A1H9W2W1_9PSEU|nr:hypothetical protein [Lentzea xinjiangensis]SES28017.1 hypothetical protein SAMN05216188_13019 [Lentzea xinjiangensis]
MSDYRGLGFDPVPGDARAVAAAGERCRHQVEVPGPPAGWEGAAAEAFAARLAEMRDELDTARRTMSAAADTLDDWAGTVLANQRRAEELDRRARELRRDIEDADNAVVLASFRGGPEHAAATARLDGLRRELDGVLAGARDLEADHRSAARRVAERLRRLVTGGVEAAGRVPSREEVFGGVVRALTGYSALGSALAGTLLSPPRTAGTPAGGAAAFASALGER